MAKFKEGFNGFPLEALDFLAGLSENNNKVWFDAQSLRLGVGVKEFDARTLSAHRDHVGGVDGSPRDRVVLHDMAELAARRGHEIVGSVLARPPKGCPDGANLELLSRKGFFVRSETALPRETLGHEFVGYCERWFRPYVPLFESLRTIALSTLGTAA